MTALAAPDCCERCGRTSAAGDLRQATVIERRRTPRAALVRPSGPDLVKADLRHTYHQLSLSVCPACYDELAAQGLRSEEALRSSTRVVLVLAALLTLAACAIEWVHPTAGPDLVGMIWRNPYAPPKPYPFQPAPAPTPYRPPF